jgi:hypothetical protein
MLDWLRKQRNLTAKALTVSAIGMGVGFGACGLGFLTNRGPVGLWRFIGSAGIILFFSSLATFVITASLAIGTKIARSFRK